MYGRMVFCMEGWFSSLAGSFGQPTDRYRSSSPQQINNNGNEHNKRTSLGAVSHYVGQGVGLIQSARICGETEFRLRVEIEASNLGVQYDNNSP